ncbi:hypothetical protein BD770DRAFT_328771, partial [Pilaira anomala]
DHRFFFLFPLRRPPPLRHFNSSLSLLFRTIDMMPKWHTNVVVTAATCLEIPLSSLVLSPGDLGRSTASLLGNQAYTFNTDQDHCLRPRIRSEFLHHPRLTKAFLTKVSTNEITLAPFFVRSFIPAMFANLGNHPFPQVVHHTIVDIDPLLKDLHLLPSVLTGHRPLTTKNFRRLCSPPVPQPSSLPPPFSPNLKFPWFQFWQLPLSHSCRNIWFRLIHKKFPHKSLLNHFMPIHFPTSACPICSSPVESFDHFVFTCPPKLQTWTHMWRTYVDPTASDVPLDTLKLVIHTLQPPISSVNLGISPISAIAATLEAIWSSHWATVFNDTLFTSTAVISLLNSKAHQARQESFLSKGIPHAPLPHIAVD